MSRHLVTGATGLIGSAIAELLVREGHDAVALVRMGTDAGPLESIGVRIARGDLTDPDAVRAAMVGCAGVFHSAALVSSPSNDMDASEKVNVGGTVNVLEAAAAEGVSRVVAIGTAAAFDTTVTLTERSAINRNGPADDPYTATKTRSYLETVRRVESGQDIVTVLPGASFGPSPMGRRMVDIAGGNQRIARALRGEPARYLPMVAPWSCTTDLAVTALRAFERGVAGRRYLALGAAGGVLSIADFVNRAMALAGELNRVEEIGRDELDDPVAMAQFPPTVVAMAKKTDRPDPYFDASETEQALGYRCAALDRRLQETVSWMRTTGLV